MKWDRQVWRGYRDSPAPVDSRVQMDLKARRGVPGLLELSDLRGHKALGERVGPAASEGTRGGWGRLVPEDHLDFRDPRGLKGRRGHMD